MPEPLNIFVSYSHRDKRWLEELQVHLKPLIRKGQVNLWDDTRIKKGARWKAAIEQALNEADVAILLVSSDFLASDFINNEELQPLLKDAEDRKLTILPVIVRPSLFEDMESLSAFQAVNDPKRPLSGMQKQEREAKFVEIARIPMGEKENKPFQLSFNG